jgi:hypothetical protein
MHTKNELKINISYVTPRISSPTMLKLKSNPNPNPTKYLKTKIKKKENWEKKIEGSLTVIAPWRQ